MKYKHLALAGFLVLGSMNLSLFGGSAIVRAADMTAVWTGAAGDGQFNTAGNWQGGVVPTGDASLVFDCVARASDDYDYVTLTNNAPTFTVSEITTTNSTNADYCKLHSVNQLNFAASLTLNGVIGDDSWLTINTANATATTALTDNSSQVILRPASASPVVLNVDTYTSSSKCDQYSVLTSDQVTIQSGGRIKMNPDRGVFTVAAGGTLGVDIGADVTLNNSVTFAAGAMIGESGNCSGLGMMAGNAQMITLSGNIVLNGDVTYNLPANYTVKVTGALSGPGKFVAAAQNEATFIVDSANNTSGSPNGTLTQAERKVTEITDSKPSESLSIQSNETVILNGTRGGAYVLNGGILKGTGTVSSLDVYGTVAPGLSPGTLTVNGPLTFGSTGIYDAEILNIDNYDKIVATNVDGLDGTLKLSLLPGATINKDQKFTIIDNTGSNPVLGTFIGLAEGAQIVVGGATFSISYVGGTGNDVVLTALNDARAPGTPNTGFRAVLSSPVLVGLVGIAAVGSVLWLVKRRVQ